VQPELSEEQPSLSGVFEGQNTFESEPDILNTYFKENPPGFQEGHLRINFAAPENRRVYANATIGRQRTRIYGRNAANLKRKYNSRKAGQNAAAANTRRIAENAAKKARNAAEIARKNAEKAAGEVMASRLAAEKAAKELKAAEAKRKANAATAAQKLKDAQRAADLAAGKKPGVFGRMFKRGGNKTRRANRRGTSRRRN
jgi:hypothetical protein